MKFKRLIAGLLGTAMLIPTAATLISCNGSQDQSTTTTQGENTMNPTPDKTSAEIKVETMKVNETDTPIGLDTNPVFSWIPTTDAYDQFQTAYRVIVSSTAEKANLGEGDLWDSGKVESAFCYSVPYAGAELASHTTYYWAVQVWDADSAVATSAVSKFATGILNKNEWTGDWIGRKPDEYSVTLSDAKWIWYVGSNPGNSAPAGIPEKTQYFRLDYSPAEGKTIKEALFFYTADDEAIMYLNGVEWSETTAWSTGAICNLTGSLQENNVIAVAAHNTSNGYAGFIGKLVVTYTDGTKEAIVSDKNTWKVSETAPDGWNAVGGELSTFRTPDMYCNYDNGPWSGVALASSGDRAATLLRKELTLKGEVAEAYLSIAGLGFFELLINGKTPDDTVMNCCNTQYNKTVLYRTFDVTALLQAGENAIGVELGNSFYNEQGGVWNWASASWRDNPKLLLQMTVRYTDGTTESFASDTTWQATVDGPITFNSIYYGETYDARKELGDWANVGYDSSAWIESLEMDAPKGDLICQLEDPIRRVASFEAADIQKLDDGSYVIYAPEMISGWARITFKNQTAGNKITILYGEKILANGNVQKLGGSDGTNASWWPERYNMTDEYIAKGSESETYEPKFSYKGYAYIQIWGYDGELTKEDIILYRTANDVEVTGTFESSDQLINDLHAMMVRTMTNNLQGKPTDTPVWEKNGWLGDLNVALETFTYNFDFSNFLPNFVEIMEDCFEQYGLVPQMVPTADWGVSDHYVWNSVFVFAVYELYNTYGMEYYMEEQYSVMKKYAQNIIRSMRSSSWIAPDGQLGDWVSPMNGENLPYNESPNEGSGIVATAYVYKMLVTMAEIAEITGHSSDAKTYTSAAESIYEAFNEKFYNRSGYYATTVWYNNGSQRTRFRQTSQLVPLAFGLVPEDKIQKVVDNLVNDIVEKDYHLDTGCVGAKEILPVLANCGYADVAYKILTRRTYPSWGFMIEEGATSLWEMWETTTRSRAHYFLGTYDEWLFQYLAGITNVEQGYLKFTINPYIPDELTYVTCTESTVRGKLESSWKKNDDGTVTMTITVPFGSEATVYFPTADAAKVKWNGNAIADTMDGIRSVGTGSGHAYAVLGSGSYVFVTANDATFLSRTGAISVNVQTDLPAIKDVGDSTEEEPETEEEIVHPTGTNLAKGKTVTASSAASSPDYGWSIDRLTNGDRQDINKDGEYAGYTSSSNTGANHTEWVCIDLGSAMTINQVVCYASTPTPSVKESCYCFAEDFQIQISTDGTNWTTVYSEEDYETPSWGPLTFDFDDVEARYVRFYATSLYPKVTDGGRYYLQLCEMEVYKK